MANLYKGNDNVIELNELKDAVADTFINTATVQVTLKDRNGTDLTGQTWPLTMTYVPGSDGQYRATLKDTLNYPSGNIVTATITADDGDDRRGQWDIPVISKERDE